jgi:hypothetical protein
MALSASAWGASVAPHSWQSLFWAEVWVADMVAWVGFVGSGWNNSIQYMIFYFQFLKILVAKCKTQQKYKQKTQTHKKTKKILVLMSTTN